jgi:hypothetical protein
MYVNGFVGCFANDSSFEECGRDMSDRSLPQVKQY